MNTIMTFHVRHIINIINHHFRHDANTLDLLNYTTLHIGFKDISCIKIRRTLYMSWDNLLCEK